MKGSKETLPFIPIRSYEDLEHHQLDAVGSVIIVVNKNLEVATVREVEKKAGMNVITETRKVGESILDNVIGGLVEEMGVKKRQFSYFKYVDGMSYLGRTEFPKAGKTIHADVVVLYYDGDELEIFEPRNEVSWEGFRKLEELMFDPDVRPEVLPALYLAAQPGILENLVQAAQVQHTRPVFNGKTDEQYFQERVVKSDLYISKN